MTGYYCRGILGIWDEELLGPQRPWRTYCTCGWSERHVSESDAVAACDKHAVNELAWERAVTVDELANLEAGLCVCPCGTPADHTEDGWARCRYSEGHEFRLRSDDGEPVLMYRWNSERDYNEHIREHNMLKISLGMTHDCEVHRLITSIGLDQWAVLKQSRLHLVEQTAVLGENNLNARHAVLAKTFLEIGI